MKAVITAAALAAAFVASPAWAQTTGTANISSADRQFIVNAGHGNAAEVAMGKIAAQKSPQPAIQEFGRWIETDLIAANHQLVAAAAAAHAPAPPTSPDSQQQKMADSLQKLNATQFDQQYIQHMVTAHQQYAQSYEKEIDSTQSKLLKAYAEATLPIIKAHLSEAQKLESTSTAMASAAPMTGTAMGTGIGGGIGSGSGNGATGATTTN